MRRFAIIVALVLMPLALWAALPLGSSGAPTAQTSQRIQRKIESTRSKITARTGKERVLTTDITRFSRRINVLQTRQNTIQSDLDDKRAKLADIQSELRHERAKLARMKIRLGASRRILATRLVELYKAGEPDLVTVLLQSDGFANLIENTDFINRVNDQDTRVITAVREARDDAHVASVKLAKLETRQQRLTAVVLARRNQVAVVKGRLDNVRAGKQSVLQRVRASRHGLEQHLEGLEKEQAKVEAQIRKAQGMPDAGPIRRGSGSMIWPVNGPITGSFGEPRPGHMHAGLDIAAPEGTPIRAADSGRVILAAYTGGYGNYTCVSHGGALSTCYAHQSRYGTSTGANVSKGQVIGYVGNTGHSFGAHLHFEVRVNGSPVNPLNYL